MPANQHNPASLAVDSSDSLVKKDNKMRKLTRFFAAGLLVASLSAVVLARGDGGQTQGPPAPVAAPSTECPTGCSNTVMPPASDSILTGELGNSIVMWLVEAIL